MIDWNLFWNSHSTSNITKKIKKLASAPTVFFFFHPPPHPRDPQMGIVTVFKFYNIHVFYYIFVTHQLRRNWVCFDVTSNRVDSVTESQGVPIIVYDYYEPGNSLITCTLFTFISFDQSRSATIWLSLVLSLAVAEILSQVIETKTWIYTHGNVFLDGITKH